MILLIRKTIGYQINNTFMNTYTIIKKLSAGFLIFATIAVFSVSQVTPVRADGEDEGDGYATNYFGSGSDFGSYGSNYETPSYATNYETPSYATNYTPYATNYNSPSYASNFDAFATNYQTPTYVTDYGAFATNYQTTSYVTDYGAYATNYETPTYATNYQTPTYATDYGAYATNYQTPTYATDYGAYASNYQTPSYATDYVAFATDYGAFATNYNYPTNTSCSTCGTTYNPTTCSTCGSSYTPTTYVSTPSYNYPTNTSCSTCGTSYVPPVRTPTYNPPVYTPTTYTQPPTYTPPTYVPPVRCTTCGTIPTTPVVYNPPTYNPPTYNPPTYIPPVYNPPVYIPPTTCSTCNYVPPTYNPPVYYNNNYTAYCVGTTRGNSIEWNIFITNNIYHFTPIVSWTGSNGFYGYGSTATYTYPNGGVQTANATVNLNGQIQNVSCTSTTGGGYVSVNENPGGVYLSSIPATGLSANMKNVLFMVGLLMWSAFLAYMYVARRNSSMKFAHALNGNAAGDSVSEDASASTEVISQSVDSKISDMARAKNVLLSHDALQSLVNAGESHASAVLAKVANNGEWSTLNKAKVEELLG